MISLKTKTLVSELLLLHGVAFNKEQSILNILARNKNLILEHAFNYISRGKTTINFQDLSSFFAQNTITASALEVLTLVNMHKTVYGDAWTLSE